MATVVSMKEFQKSVDEFANKHPDLIPIFTDVGYGRHSVPSKKNKHFTMGDVRIPSEALKEEYHMDLRKLHDVNIKTIVFIPKEMASDKVLKLLEENEMVE